MESRIFFTGLLTGIVLMALVVGVIRASTECDRAMDMIKNCECKEIKK